MFLFKNMFFLKKTLATCNTPHLETGRMVVMGEAVEEVVVREMRGQDVISCK